MNFNYLSTMIIPLLVLFIVIYGFKKKVNIYDTFISGSKEAVDMILNIFPCLLAMVLAINIFLKSDILTFIFDLISPVFNYLKIPKEILPMAIMRPISGSSTLVLLNTILIDYGPDSFIGRIASVLQGATDTTLYILTLYFGSVGIKKIRYSLWAGLFADLIGIMASIILVSLLFK